MGGGLHCAVLLHVQGALNDLGHWVSGLIHSSCSSDNLHVNANVIQLGCSTVLRQCSINTALLTNFA